MELPQLTNEQIEEHILMALRCRNVECEMLTEKQLACVVRQAIECGDIERNVSIDGLSQNVIYTPNARAILLTRELESVNGALAQETKVAEINASVARNLSEKLEAAEDKLAEKDAAVAIKEGQLQGAQAVIVGLEAKLAEKDAEIVRLRELLTKKTSKKF